VSSRIEIGLLNMKGAEEGYGVGALMLPEAFFQKVKSQWRHYNVTHNFSRSSQDYAQFHGGRALELQVGGGGEANRKAVWQVLVEHEILSTMGPE